MNEREYHVMICLKPAPLSLMALAVKLNGAQDVQGTWNRAAALVQKGYLAHYAHSKTYGQFGLTDLGRQELAFYQYAFGLASPKIREPETDPPF